MILLLGKESKEIKSFVHKDLYVNTLAELFTTAKKEQPKVCQVTNR